MKHWLKVVGAGTGGIVLGAAAAVAIGRRGWNRAIEKAIESLEREVYPTHDLLTANTFANLPAPVSRYFRFALPDTPHSIREARLTQEGEFNLAGLEARWKPMTAQQVFTTEPPGFVWDARVRMAPGVAVHVRDSYVAGIGTMQAKIAGLVRVVDQSGTPELASGALQRYLAEAAWFPMALLPEQSVVWEPIDDTRAKAILTDGATSVSLDFTFGEQGEITQIYTPARYRDAKGIGVPTPWLGTFRDYKRINGMMIPTWTEVSWILPEGKLTYYRARISGLVYEYD